MSKPLGQVAYEAWRSHLTYPNTGLAASARLAWEDIAEKVVIAHKQKEEEK